MLASRMVPYLGSNTAEGRGHICVLVGLGLPVGLLVCQLAWVGSGFACVLGAAL